MIREGAIFIPLAAVVACLPRFMLGVSCGHDFDFHLVSWMETQRAWSQGIVYPHWAQSPNWGAGEPRFVFYPPISWMAGAAIGSVVGWQWAGAVFTWLCFAANGFTTRALARNFLPGRAATLAGVLATATPYAMFVAYERTAFSELAAAALFPLLLLSALRPEPMDGGLASLLPGACRLTLILAAIWLTNAPSGVMASYLLAGTALAAALLQRAWGPALRAAVAAPLALGLAAVYLVPAAWEQRWIAIHQALDVGMRVADSWLFARHAAPGMELHDEVLHVASVILVATAIAATGAWEIARRMGSLAKLPRSARSWRIPIALLIPIVVLLQFPVAGPLWALPKMQFLQFPWRWLVVLDIPFAIFLAAAAPLENRRGRWIASLAVACLLLASAGFAARSFFQVCDDEDNVTNQAEVFQDGTGVEGTDEYAPVGADNTLVASTLPDACLVSDPTRDLGESKDGAEPVWYPEQGSCDQTFKASRWENEHKVLQVDTDHEGFLVLRERRYPAWAITVNGRRVITPLPSREDGLLVLPVAAGPSTIDVRWTATPDVLWGRWLSLAGALVFAILAWIGWTKRPGPIHLSS